MREPVDLAHLTDQTALDPDKPEAALAQVPARHGVYLLADADNRPVQLLCVRNMRASLKRRLGTDDRDLPSRRIDYAALVRRVHWRRVDSAFEADLVYLETARACFPDSYGGWLGFKPAWWVHVNPATTCPRFVKTNTPTLSTGRYFGPLGDKHDAQKLVHAIEEMFDLCRDYTILQQAPAAACNWKQMGKCVGPCDGTVSLAEYARIVGRAADALGEPESAVFALELDMKQAATDLKFEEAARLKGRIDRLKDLRQRPRHHVGRLQDFAWLVVMPGPGVGTAKVFTVTPHAVDQHVGLIDEPRKASDLLRELLLVTAHRPRPREKAHVERVGLVTHHLFLPKAKQEGVFLRADSITDKDLRAAFRKVAAVERPEPDAEDEGVLKEIQTL